MLLAVVISFILLALVAGMLLLAKTRKDNLGEFFSFVSWFVIVFSFVLIVFSISAHICKRVMHHRMCCERGFMPGPGGMMGWGYNCCCMGWGDKEKGMCRGGQEMNMMGPEHDMDKMCPEEKADNKVKMLTEKLKLTNEQIPKVKEILLKSFLACEQNMKEAGGDKDKCDKMCEKTCKDKLDALKKVLTPEQFKNLPECCTKK